MSLFLFMIDSIDSCPNNSTGLWLNFFQALHEKNDFAERSKILDTDMKIILLEHKNNEQCRKKFWYYSN